jgi:hypothetical protein
MLMSIISVYAQLGGIGVIDGFIEAIVQGLYGLMGRGGDDVQSTLPGILETIFRTIAYTPTPERSGPFAEPTDPFWSAVYDSADQFVEITFIALFAGVLLVLVLSGVGLVSDHAKRKFGVRAMVAFIALIASRVYLEVLIIILQIVDGIVQFFMPPVVGEGGLVDAFLAAFQLGGGSELIIFIVMLLLFILLLVILFISLIRIAGIFFLVVLIPGALGLWAIGVGPLQSIGETGKKGFSWFVSLAIFPIPAAVAFNLGVHFMGYSTIPIPGANGESAGSQLALLIIGAVFMTVGVAAGVYMTKLGGAITGAAVKAGTVAAAGYVGGPAAAASVASDNVRSFRSATGYGSRAGAEEQQSDAPENQPQSPETPQGPGEDNDAETQTENMGDEPDDGIPMELVNTEPAGALPAPSQETDPTTPAYSDPVTPTPVNPDLDSVFDDEMKEEIRELERAAQGNREVARDTSSNNHQPSVPNRAGNSNTVQTKIQDHTSDTGQESAVNSTGSEDLDIDFSGVDIDGADPNS